jgi:hypothetical protein
LIIAKLLFALLAIVQIHKNIINLEHQVFLIYKNLFRFSVQEISQDFFEQEIALLL